MFECLAALVACTEPTPKDPTGPSVPITTLTTPEPTTPVPTVPTVPTTPTATGPCESTSSPSWTVGTPTADPTVEPTCAAVDPVDYGLVVEWETHLPSFVMNVVVAPSPATGHASVFLDTEQTAVELDGADGSEVAVVPMGMGYVSDDGSTGAVGDTDGDGWSEYLVVLGTSVVRVDSANGVMTAASQPWVPVSDEVVQYRDVDLDGAFDQVLPTGVFDEAGAVVVNVNDGGTESTGAFVADLEGDGSSALFNNAGVWNAATGAGAGWDNAIQGSSFYGVPVDDGGDLGAVFTLGSGSLAFGHADGTLAWLIPDTFYGWTLALGDATGDGEPDICAKEARAVVLIDLQGTVLQRWDLGNIGGGGCSMADLDADGIYEVLVAGNGGFFILDGVTGGVLASVPDLVTVGRDSAPVVADIDGDGSAEILVAADDGFPLTRVVALGPASGRWARTRPVWHQLAYDITSIRDDGSLVSAPVAPWETYRAYRAQPSHDGVHPDLEVTVVVTDAVGPPATMEIAVTNRGSATAPAGTVLRLVSWSGLLLEELLTATIDGEIAPGERVDTTVEVDPCELEALWFAEAVAAGEECDYVNNRVEGHP